MDYKEKYLKYKLKYLELKKLIGGTNFVTLYNDIKLTDAHLEELYDNKPELFKTSNTLDGLKKIMDILESGKFSNGKSFPFGVKNKSIQPKWYTENPTLFTIVKDKELLKKFKTELNEYYKTDEPFVSKPIQLGGLTRTEKAADRAFEEVQNYDGTVSYRGHGSPRPKAAKKRRY
jgi:hypothetical protein